MKPGWLAEALRDAKLEAERNPDLWARVRAGNGEFALTIGWQPLVTSENEAWVYRWWDFKERAWEFRWFRKSVMRFGFQCMRGR